MRPFDLTDNERRLTAERLGMLADFLDALPPQRFDYRRWVGADWKGDPGLVCGTTGCALGWAAAMPAFQALGLGLVPEDNERTFDGGFRAAFTLHGERQSDPFEVGEEVFGLTRSESRFLFAPLEDYGGAKSPDNEASARDVAAHIRRFVAERDALARAEAGANADD